MNRTWLLLLFLLNAINLLGSTLVWYGNAQPKVGIVDPQVLITNQAAKIAKNYPNDMAPANKLQQIAKNLKETAADYAKEHKMLLLVKNAVWGGNLPDHTDQIIDAIKEE